MLVLCEVCTPYCSLGYAIVELDAHQTQAFLAWLEKLREHEGNC